MIKAALAKLNHRSEQLRARLNDGNSMEVKAARELMRHALVELYELGHWRENPAELDGYMQVYRASYNGIDFSVTVSRSAPGRMVQYSP